MNKEKDSLLHLSALLAVELNDFIKRNGAPNIIATTALASVFAHFALKEGRTLSDVIDRFSRVYINMQERKQNLEYDL